MIELVYKKKRSVFHDASPFLKISWLLSILLTSIIFEHPIILSVLLLSSFLVALASKVFREWAGVMRLALFFVPFVVLFNMIVNANGETGSGSCRLDTYIRDTKCHLKSSVFTYYELNCRHPGRIFCNEFND